MDASVMWHILYRVKVWGLAATLFARFEGAAFTCGPMRGDR